MRRLLIALAIVVVFLVIGDFVAKGVATAELQDRAQAAVRGATSSSASISSFPFVARLLMFGSVHEVEVGVGPVRAGRLTFSSVGVDLHDVHVDRDRLINDRKVQLTSIGSGKVTATITDDEISRLTGVPIVFTPGRVSVQAAGVELGAQLSMEDGNLVVGGAKGVPIRLRVPRATLFPCDATTAVAKEGKVEVSCTITRVPPELAGVTVSA